ncbi:MAG: LysR family transcriptional regulator, partial [Verrucomicrobiota bacterium]
MELRLQPLRVFLEVAQDQNISAAARRLGISQPALSRQIKGFEEELGWELLERGGKSVQLTRAGEVVAQEGKRILRAVESGYERMRREIEGAEMRVGYAPSLAEGLIERAMRCFVEKHPRVRVSWYDSSTEEMWRKLGTGELDLILEVATDDPAITWTT